MLVSKSMLIIIFNELGMRRLFARLPNVFRVCEKCSIIIRLIDRRSKSGA